MVNNAQNACGRNVKWSDIINDVGNRLFIDVDQCQERVGSCHPSCNSHCWGPGPDDCQKRTYIKYFYISIFI